MTACDRGRLEPPHAPPAVIVVRLDPSPMEARKVGAQF
jgi:hypothetical protein